MVPERFKLAAVSDLEMSAVAFAKLHGLGNDFILFDGLLGELPSALHDPGVARRLCDRRRGIGGDGLLLVLPPDSSGASARMIVLNADGSRPQMCGNGIRCVARFLGTDHPELLTGNIVRIATDAGVLQCSPRPAPGDRPGVEVAMGAPSFARERLPMNGSGLFIDGLLSSGDRTLRATAVSMGNPHLVLFCEDPSEVERRARELGPELERHPAFPERTNVEVAHLRSPANIELWVWERGCGITQACGTGACATAAAAVATNRSPANRWITVELPGGQLAVRAESQPDGDAISGVTMVGPAEEVYRGSIDIGGA